MPRCLITDERLSREKPGPRRHLLDTRLTGFQVVITPRAKTFVVRTRRFYRSIGRWPHVTADQARDAALEVLRKYLAAPALVAPTARVKVPILKDAFEAYLKGKRLKPKSVETYRAILKAAAPELMEWPLSSITTAVYTERFSAIRSKSQANLHARLVGAIYVYTNAALGLALSNPAATLRKVTGLHEVGAKTRYIRDDQQAKWYAGVQALKHRVAADLFLALALTGARRDEMRKLRWADVDMGARMMRFPDTKTGHPHALPIGDRLAEILERRRVAPDHPERVFPIEEDMVYHHAKKVIAASGVDFSPHDLRRGFATLAARLVKDELVVKALLNHAPSGVTQRHYIVRDVTALKGPMAAVNAFLTRLWDATDSNRDNSVEN